MSKFYEYRCFKCGPIPTDKVVAGLFSRFCPYCEAQVFLHIVDEVEITQREDWKHETN